MSRDLRPLFAPKSIAVVGVSSDPGKWGYWFARDAAKGAHRRRVFLVGRSGGELHGLPVHRSLAELPEPPELVVLSVPAASLESVVGEALAAGARALVAVAAGLGELGESGAERERSIVARVREAGAVLLGPNCLGVFDAAGELDLASNPLPSGPIGFVSQSGNIALETGLLLADVGLGYSRLASVGNQADLDVTDVLCDLAAHEGTRVIGVYCEDFRNGRAFAEVARTAGKPVVLMTVGGTDAAIRAARSHTGALTSPLDVVDAACRAAGVHRVDTPRQLVDLAQALLAAERPRGRWVGVVGDGGGYGAVASDLLGSCGLELPLLPADVQESLRASLPPTAAVANPVDLAGAGEQDTFSFARTTRTLLECDAVDAVLFTAYFGGYSSLSEELREREVAVARELAAAVHATGKPLVVHTMYWDAPPARALRADGIAVYRAVESAVAALSALAADGRPATPVTPVPRAEAPVVSTGYTDARAALAHAGVPFGASRAAATRDEAVGAAHELGYPVVLKALGALHKSDAGGVVLGLRGRRGGRRGRGGARRPVLGGGAGRHGRGARAARGLPLGRALRPGDRGRRGRRPCRALPRHGRRVGARRRRPGVRADRLVGLRPAARGRARAVGARPPGGCHCRRRALALRRCPSGARRGRGEPAARPRRRRSRSRRALRRGALTL